MKKITIVFILLAFLAGASYLFYQNQILEKQVADLKYEKAEVEKEFAVLKASDLAKEIEVLQLKLKTVEKDLADEKNALAKITREKSDIMAELRAVKSRSAQIKVRLDAIDALERMVGAGPNTQSVAAADARVSAIKETGVAGAWVIAKGDIDFTRMSWNGNTIADTVISITTSIRELLP